MGDVLHHAVHRPAEELFVFVVHGHDDEQLGPPRRVVQHLPERESFLHEVVRVTRRGRVPHVRELALITLLTHVQQLGRHLRVQYQVSVKQSTAAASGRPNRETQKQYLFLFQ